MIKKGRIQIALWLMLLGINFGFSSHILPLHIAPYATVVNVFLLAVVFYGNGFVLFPRYFDLQNNRRFFVISFLFILIIACLQFWGDVLFFVKYSLRQAPRENFRHIFLFFKSFFWMWLVDLISIVFLMQDRIKEQWVHAQEMKEEKLNTELKLLKAQINPHFIFNALNNIYSLSYIKSDKAPDSVLKLSQMLRYVLEECTHDRVSLSAEIEYIENFIGFQQMKSQKAQNIVFDYEGADSHWQVAPMLFIPFIENSFKYSQIEALEKGFVEIRIKSTEEKLQFEIRNSVPDSVPIRPGAGMGIENVKQRLEIIYPGHYLLDIRKESQTFCVNLEIQLK